MADPCHSLACVPIRIASDLSELSCNPLEGVPPVEFVETFTDGIIDNEILT
jgi:hypothetical protein